MLLDKWILKKNIARLKMFQIDAILMRYIFIVYSYSNIFRGKFLPNTSGWRNKYVYIKICKKKKWQQFQIPRKCNIFCI